MIKKGFLLALFATPGADLGDNDFVGKPEIVSCEAIVYTKDGDGWIGAKIEKK